MTLVGVQNIEKGEKVKFHMPGRSWAFAIWYMVYCLFSFAFVTVTSMMAVAEGIATTAELGVTMSLMTVSAAATGAFYGLFAKGLKKYIIVVGVAVSTIAAFIALTGHSLLQINISMILCGFGLGLAVPGVLTRIPTLVPAASTTMAISIFTAVAGLGQFIQPLVFAWLQDIFNITDYRQSFLISFSGLIVVLVYIAVDTFASKGSKTAADPS